MFRRNELRKESPCCCLNSSEAKACDNCYYKELGFQLRKISEYRDSSPHHQGYGHDFFGPPEINGFCHYECSCKGCYLHKQVEHYHIPGIESKRGCRKDARKNYDRVY